MVGTGAAVGTRRADPWEEAPWGAGLRQLPSPPSQETCRALTSPSLLPCSLEALGNVTGPRCRALAVNRHFSQPCSQCDISHKRKPSGCKGWYQDSVSPARVLALPFWTPPYDSDQLPPLPIPPTARDPARGPQVPIIPWEQASFSVACADIPGPPAHCSDLNLPHSSLHTVLEMPGLSWSSRNMQPHVRALMSSLSAQGPSPGPSLHSGLCPHLTSRQAFLPAFPSPKSAHAPPQGHLTSYQHDFLSQRLSLPQITSSGRAQAL